MTKVSEIYQNANFLNANDVPKPITAKIKGVTVEAMKDGKKKIVLVLEGVEKSLALNKTNSKTLESRFGEVMEEWKGEEIQLASVPVEFQGSMTKGLRIL